MRDALIVVLPGSQPADRWFSEYTPMFTVSNNINEPTYLAQGGRIENVTMLQTGYINSQNDLLNGIVINDENRNVVVKGGLYSAPDYAAPSRLFPMALNSTGKNTVVEDFRAIGKTKTTDRTFGNINLSDGIVRNSAADFILAKGANVQFENNRPNSNAPPVLSALTAKAVAESSLLTFTASAKDLNNSTNDTLDINQKLTFSLASGAPGGAAIHPDTGLFSWTPSEEQGEGVYSITVKVTDNGTPSLSASQTFTVTVNDANAAPVFKEIPAQTVRERETLLLDLAASDADLPKQILAYSLGPGAPPGAAIDPVTGMFRWVPGYSLARPEPYPVLVAVSDSLSRTELPFAITVLNVNRPPVLDPIPSQSVVTKEAWTFNLKFRDDDGDALRFSLEPGAPAGFTLEATTGRLAWTPTETQTPGTYSITVRVTDSGSPPLSDAKTFTVKVSEVKIVPVLSAIPDQVVNEGTSLSFTLTATVNGAPAQDVFYLLGPGAPEGAGIDPLLGEFFWTPTEAQDPAFIGFQ